MGCCEDGGEDIVDAGPAPKTRCKSQGKSESESGSALHSRRPVMSFACEHEMRPRYAGDAEAVWGNNDVDDAGTEHETRHTALGS